MACGTSEEAAAEVLAAIRAGAGAEAIALVSPDQLEETLRLLAEYDPEIVVGLLHEILRARERPSIATRHLRAAVPDRRA